MASSVEELKIRVVAETASAEKGLSGLRRRVDGLSASLGKGIPGGGKSGAAAGAAKGLNAATQILGGSLGGLTGTLSSLGPKGAAIAAAIALATKAIQQATKASQEFIGYMTQLLGKINMGTSAMREFNAELTKTARNSSVSKTDLGKFFAQTKNSFTDSSQMMRDAEFAKQLISYYGDINTAAKAYNKTLTMDLDTQKKIREQMQIQYNLTQDSGEAGLKAIKQELSETLEILGSIVLQVLNPLIQGIKVILGALNTVLGIVKNIFGAFSGLTGAGTMADAMMDGAEATGEASDAMDKLNDEMDLYNGKLSGLDEVSTLDSGDSFGLANNPDLDAMQGALEDTNKGFSIATGPLNFISDAFQKVGDILEKTIAPVLGVVKGFIDGIRDAMGEVFDDGSSLLDTVLEPIGTIIGRVVQLLVGILTPVLNVVSKIIKTIFTVISKIFKFVSKILEVVMQVLMSVLEPIFTVLEAVFGIIVEVFDMLFDLLFSILDPILEVIMEVMDVFMEIFSVVGEIIGEITNELKPILDVIISLVRTVFEAFKPIFDIVKNIFETALKPILNTIKQIVNVVKTVLMPVFNVLKGVIGAIGNAIKFMMNLLIDGINLVIKAINAMSQGLSSLWTWTGLPGIPKMPEIKRLASGGSAEIGELINIRENGPELVSYGAGRMEVMNNDQIMASVARGVADGLRGADIGGGGSFNLYVDGQELNVRLEKAKQRSGRQNIGSKVRQGGY